MLPSRELCAVSLQAHTHVGVGCSMLTCPQCHPPRVPILASHCLSARSIPAISSGDAEVTAWEKQPWAAARCYSPREHIWLLWNLVAKISPWKCHPRQGARGGLQHPHGQSHIWAVVAGPADVALEWLGSCVALRRLGRAFHNVTNVCHMVVLSSWPREEKRVWGSARVSILEHPYVSLGVCGSGRSGMRCEGLRDTRGDTPAPAQDPQEKAAGGLVIG